MPLYDYYREYGGVYNLGAGPKWFVVVSDPAAVRTMFKDKADSFSKGILTDIMKPIMGDKADPRAQGAVGQAPAHCRRRLPRRLAEDDGAVRRAKRRDWRTSWSAVR